MLLCYLGWKSCEWWGQLQSHHGHESLLAQHSISIADIPSLTISLFRISPRDHTLAVAEQAAQAP
jgi:hypothetical protein